MRRGGPQTRSDNVGKETFPLPEIIPRFTDRPAYNLIAILLDTRTDTSHQTPLSSFVFGRSHVLVLARRTATLNEVSVFLQSLQSMPEEKPESGQDRLLSNWLFTNHPIR